MVTYNTLLHKTTKLLSLRYKYGILEKSPLTCADSSLDCSLRNFSSSVPEGLLHSLKEYRKTQTFSTVHIYLYIITYV